MHDSGTTTIDFAIVTALPEELSAVRRQLGDVRLELPDDDDPIAYYRGSIGEYDVVAFQLTATGNVEAARAVTALLHRYRPRAVLVVGIAAGLESDTELGDVLVSTEITYYEAGKIGAAGRVLRPESYRPDSVLAGRSAAFSMDWNGALVATRPVADRERVPAIHHGQIVAGENVVADAAFMTDLKGHFRRMIGLAMEGGGAAAAAARFGRGVGVLEIRGVCDFGTGAKNDSWHEYAADAAAAYAAAFLRWRPLRSRAQFAATPSSASRSIRLVRLAANAPVDSNEVAQQLEQEGYSIDAINIDLRGVELQTAEGFRSACAAMTNPEGALLRGLEHGQDIALLGHATISAGAVLGRIVGNRHTLRFFDYHVAEPIPTWLWPSRDDISVPPLCTPVLIEPREPTEIALLMGVSYRVRAEHVAAVLPDAITTSLTLDAPRRGVIQCESQLRTYAASFLAFLDRIASLDAPPRRLHVFYAGPLTLAMAMGAAILPSVHPDVTFWEYSRGYTWGVDLASAARGFPVFFFPQVTA